MATVTMKLFILNRVISVPLIQPIRQPNTSITAIATRGFASQPNPPVPTAAIISPPTIAVRPMVDSDDRSKLPVIRVNDWPMTSRPRAATRTKMLTRL